MSLFEPIAVKSETSRNFYPDVVCSKVLCSQPFKFKQDVCKERQMPAFVF